MGGKEWNEYGGEGVKGWRDEWGGGGWNEKGLLRKTRKVRGG